MDRLMVEMPLVFLILKVLTYVLIYFSVASVLTGAAILASDLYYKYRRE